MVTKPMCMVERFESSPYYKKNNINTKRMKKEYKKPQIKEYELQNTTIICGSPENYSEYISGPGDWGDDPIIDPDDEIDW